MNLCYCKSNNTPCSSSHFANVCLKFINPHHTFLPTLSPFFFILINFLQGILNEEDGNNPRTYYHHWDYLLWNPTPNHVKCTQLQEEQTQGLGVLCAFLIWSWSRLHSKAISETWGPKWCDIFINIETQQNDSSFNTLEFTWK